MSKACLLEAQKFLDGSNTFQEILDAAAEEAKLRADGDPIAEQMEHINIVNQMIEDMELESVRKAKQLFYMVQSQQEARLRVDELVRQGKNPYEAIRDELAAQYDAARQAGASALVSFHAAIDTENLGRYIADEANHLNIVKEIAELNKAKGNPGIGGDKDALRVAQIYETHIQSARGTLLKLGVDVSNLEGRVFKQVFMRENLKRISKTQFTDDMVPRLDVYRTFGRKNVSRAKQIKYVQEYYDDVINGHIGDMEPTAFDTSTQKSTYAKKQSEHRYLHLARPEDTLHVMRTYTSDSFVETLNRSIKDVHHNRALIQSQGVNTRFAFKKLKKYATEKYEKTHPKHAKKIASSAFLETMYSIGTNDWQAENYSPTWAELQQISVTMSRLAFLGGAGIASVGDLGTLMVSAFRTQGMGESFGSIGKFMQIGFADIDKLPFEEQRALRASAELQSAYAGGLFASFSSDFVAGSGTLGKIAKGSTYLQNLMFKYNGLNLITKTGKMTASLGHAAQTVHYSGIEWAKLNKGFRFRLLRGGITEREWDIIRANKDILTRKFQGHEYIDPYLASSIPDSALADMVFAGAGKNQYDLARDALVQKLLAAQSVAADEAIPTPGVREQAIMTLGSQPGTGARAFIANAGNFLSYPITWMTKVAGRSLEAADSPAQVAGIAGYMIAAGLFYGTVADFLANLNKGQIRDYDGMLNGDAPAGDFISSVVLRSGLGGIAGSIVNDFIMYGSGASDIAAAPAFGLADDVLGGLRSSSIDMFEGDHEKSLMTMVGLLRNVAPLEFPGAGTAFDAMIYFPMMEMFDPQKLGRIERSMEDRGKEYLFPRN